MRAVLAIAAAASLMIAIPAYAGSAEDGNAGLEALNRGSYGEAIRLFTRALKAGDLSNDDQEFAYLNRGKAYLAEHKKTLALGDFKKATSLKPDDPDIVAALKLARTGVASVAPEPAIAPAYVNPDAAWGILARQLDTYWIEDNGSPIAYSVCHWQTPHLVIACEGLGKNGKPSAATYELDPATGNITLRQVSPFQMTAQVVVHGDSYEIDIETQGKYVRETSTPVDAAADQVTIELYDAGAWKTIKTEKMVQASSDVVNALGWRLGKDKTHSFWKDLGQSIVEGAAAGIVQGLQGQPQQ